MKVEIVLPYPPSANRIWRKNGAGRIYLVPNAKAFKGLVRDLVVTGKFSGFGAALLKIKIEIYPPDKRKRDIDNVIKILLDALKFAGMYDDDCQIKKLEIAMLETKKNGEVLVKIEELNDDIFSHA